MRTRTRLSAILLVTLAACSSGPSPTPRPSAEPAIEPMAALTEALTNAYGVDTLHEEFTMTFSAGGQEFALSGSADVDNTNQRAAMSMDLGMLGGTMDMVMSDGVAYMRSPMLSGDVDTEWVSMDLARLNPVAGAQFSGGVGGATDASSYAALLAGVVEARGEGHEVIDGVDTTHYVGRIDVLKASRGVAELLGDEIDARAQKQLERAILQLKVLGMKTAPFEAWVDADGLLRRERFSMDLGMMPGAETATMEMTIDFSSYGEPVQIDVPPRSKVTDITHMIEAGAGG